MIAEGGASCAFGTRPNFGRATLRAVQLRNLHRPLRRLLQMMSQFFLKLLDAPIHGHLLGIETNFTRPLVRIIFPEIAEFSD